MHRFLIDFVCNVLNTKLTKLFVVCIDLQVAKSVMVSVHEAYGLYRFISNSLLSNTLIHSNSCRLIV